MTERVPSLLVATTNAGKLREFGRLLPFPARVLGLAEVSVQLPEETGTSFASNACAKAVAASAQTGYLTLADDSGLEVETLGGAPGVRSARYAGHGASDQDNREALLRALAGVEVGRRQARFVCALALARNGQVVALTEGTLRGLIGEEPRGSGGFGYDPLFVLADGRTVAQLDAEAKNRVGHRGRAFRRMLPVLSGQLGLSGVDGADRG